jgi:hypothetical protein
MSKKNMSNDDFIKMFGAELLELILKKKKQRRKKRRNKKINKINDPFPKNILPKTNQPLNSGFGGAYLGGIINNPQNIPQKAPAQVDNLIKDKPNELDKYKEFLEFGNDYYNKEKSRYMFNNTNDINQNTSNNPLTNETSNYLLPHYEIPDNILIADNYGHIARGLSSDEFMGDDDSIKTVVSEPIDYIIDDPDIDDPDIDESKEESKEESKNENIINNIDYNIPGSISTQEDMVNFINSQMLYDITQIPIGIESSINRFGNRSYSFYRYPSAKKYKNKMNEIDLIDYLNERFGFDIPEPK